MPITLPPTTRRDWLKQATLAGAGLFSTKLHAATDAESSESWLLFSDTHVSEDLNLEARGACMAKHLEQAVREALTRSNEKPFGLMVNGDCAYKDGQPGDYSALVELLRPIREAGIPIHLTLGNHDHRENFLASCGSLDTSLLEEKKPVAHKHVAVVGSALANWVLNGHPELDPNTSNSASGDVVIGYIYDPSNLGESLNLGDPSLYNSVRVLVRRNSIRNGSILHKFATIFGNSSADLGATATATFKDGVVGYKVTDKTGNADLLPLALQKDYWAGLLDWSLSTGDNYAYDPATGAVTAGHDGIPELNLFPGAGSGQLPPGNFGTVDIGSPNNSAADLSRQIRYGISADDLAYFGGELNLGSDGVLPLNGDTGLTASIKDDLISILGQPRAIPIFSTVSGPGNNSVFNVVGFVGIRIMNVRLTGAMKSKEVVIQPAYVVDDAVITAAGAGSSYFVYEPVHLTR